MRKHYMGVKTMTVKDEAYNTLKARKAANESFSDAIIRLAGSRPLDYFFGVLSEASAQKLEKVIRESRKERNARHSTRRGNIQHELS